MVLLIAKTKSSNIKHNAHKKFKKGNLYTKINAKILMIVLPCKKKNILCQIKEFQCVRARKDGHSHKKDKLGLKFINARKNRSSNNKEKPMRMKDKNKKNSKAIMNYL